VKPLSDKSCGSKQRNRASRAIQKSRPMLSSGFILINAIDRSDFLLCCIFRETQTGAAFAKNTLNSQKGLFEPAQK